MLMKSLLLALLLSCFLVSCDYGSEQVILESNSLPPTFKLEGSDRLQWIWVLGPYQNKREPAPPLPAPDDPKKIIIWNIGPGGDLPMKQAPAITYGQLPDGWRQQAPQAGSPPPALLDGYVYYIRAIPVRREPAVLCVYVKGGKVEPYTDDDPSSPCK